MSTGRLDHAYDPDKSQDSTPHSAPMSETALPRPSPFGGATKPIVSNNTAAMDKPESGDNKIHKRSLDYVMRSGIAGGLAGCAVSFHGLSIIASFILINAPDVIGQDCSSAPRPREDPLPGVKPSIRQIYGQLDWPGSSDSRYQAH